MKDVCSIGISKIELNAEDLGCSGDHVSPIFVLVASTARAVHALRELNHDYVHGLSNVCIAGVYGYIEAVLWLAAGFVHVAAAPASVVCLDVETEEGVVLGLPVTREHAEVWSVGEGWRGERWTYVVAGNLSIMHIKNKNASSCRPWLNLQF